MGAKLVDELLSALDAQTVVVAAQQSIGCIIRDVAAGMKANHRHLQMSIAANMQSRDRMSP